MMSRRFLVLGICLWTAIVVEGCASQQYSAVPPDLDRTAVRVRTLEISASRYSFSPEVLHVAARTLVQFKIMSTEGTHGFSLSDFGVDVKLVENQEETLEVFFPKAGTYGFRCSHICGIGHLGMTGKIIVE